VAHIAHLIPRNYGFYGLKLREAYLSVRHQHIFTVSPFAASKINEKENLVHTDLYVLPDYVRRRYRTRRRPHLPPMALGRCNPEKQLHLALDMATIYTPSPCPTLPGAKIGFSYPRIMLRLAQSKCLISTWPMETFGLQAFEAMQRGTPVILHAKKTMHASQYFLPQSHYVLVDTYRIRKTEYPDIFRNAIESANFGPRQDLADYAYESYNRDKYVQIILAVIETCK
jgi:hypothetical protein